METIKIENVEFVSVDAIRKAIEALVSDWGVSGECAEGFARGLWDVSACLDDIVADALRGDNSAIVIEGHVTHIDIRDIQHDLKSEYCYRLMVSGFGEADLGRLEALRLMIEEI